MMEEIQVVTIANAFELVYESILPYSDLTELAKADESHFGQKAAFWTTRYGFPKVVVCSSRPAEMLVNRIYESHLQPTFIEPRRSTSSICADLLRDESAVRMLFSILDRNKRVFLAPYVHTSGYEALAKFLFESGYNLVDYRDQAQLVKRLWSKTETQRHVFDAVDILKSHRPKSIEADTNDSRVNGIAQFARSGIMNVVVKSASAVGGSGVFYVRANEVSKDMPPREFLMSSGQNEPIRSAPFIIEEQVHWDVSPTVDLDISAKGEIDFVGVALQRLHNRRYYNGFYSSPQLEQQWWFEKVESLAEAVGLRLFELGYTGPANVDFVASTKDRQVTLIEVNPRRSALIDGYGIRDLRGASDEWVSVSATDYVNISSRFDRLSNVFDLLSSSLVRTDETLLVSDGGFSTSYRWVGLLTIGRYPADSEDILTELVSKLQDPKRDETGSAVGQTRRYSRIDEEVG